RSELRDRQRPGASRPVVLARQSDSNGWQLPEIELLTPARNDRARQTFCDDHIRFERQVGAMLLGRPERQTEDRGGMKLLRDRRPEIGDRALRRRAAHGSRSPPTGSLSASAV